MKCVPIHFAIVIAVTLALAACGGGDESGTDDERQTATDQATVEEAARLAEAERLEAQRLEAERLEAERLEIEQAEQKIVDEYVCMDEYEQAVAYATRDVNAAAVPDLWDGTPFVVDISSTYPNADELLDVVADEAERIYQVLGYEIFVAGDVLPLADIEDSDLWAFSRHQWIPPEQHIHIRCCYGEDISSAGISYAWLRVLLLENDDFQSRHIIMHELYHILGFAHPDQPYPDVVMSDSLMYGPGHTAFGASIPTQASPLDLAKLACIYDGGADGFDLMAAQ